MATGFQCKAYPMEEIVLMLVDSFKEVCTLLEKTRVPDGEGGWNTIWNDGMLFEAAIVKDSSTTARVAESEGMNSVYTVTVDKNIKLEFHDVFRRQFDNKTFRVTSDYNDQQTPDIASFEFMQVTAEAWNLQ